MNSLYFRLAALNYQKVLIGGIIFAVIYFFTLFDDGTSIDQNIAGTNQQITTEEGRKKEAEKTISRAEKMKAETLKLNEHYQTLSKQVPSDLSMADILRSIDAMASASGVSIKSKEPKTPSKKEIFEEFPISVKGEGNFGELTLFLYNMVATDRLTRVTSISMNRLTGGGSKNRLTLDASFTSYRYMESQEKSVPAGKEGAKK